MNLIECLKLAFNILRHSKLRSWLSIIGIVIGVASVIAIMSLGEGMKQSLSEQLGGLGSDMVTVSSGFSRAGEPEANFRREGVKSVESSLKVKNLTNKDIQAIKLVSNVAYVQGVISSRGEVKYLGQTLSANVKGIDVNVWKDMESTELESGRYLTQGDQNSVVIGSRVASSFKQKIQVNRQISIEGKIFKVVGILKESSGVVMGSYDSMIFMPIEVARTTLEDARLKDFDSIEIKVKDVNLIDETLTKMESVLMLERAVNQKNKDFSITSVKAMQETISSSISSMSLFLTAIAAISLLVGAIGIANTMFTTILEKTKEIGIMKAIGAKDKDILGIFLSNSVMISLSGGIIGGILGILSSHLITSAISGGGMGIGRMFGRGSVTVTPGIFLLVLGISVTIGILSGIIPAYRASKMNPVDALRYE